MELYELTLVVTCVQEKVIRDVFAQNDWKFIIAGIKRHDKDEDSFGVSLTRRGNKEDTSSEAFRDKNIDIEKSFRPEGSLNAKLAVKLEDSSKSLNRSESSLSEMVKDGTKHRETAVFRGEEKTVSGQMEGGRNNANESGKEISVEGEAISEGGEAIREGEVSSGEEANSEGEVSSEGGEVTREKSEGSDGNKDISTIQNMEKTKDEWIYCSICGEVFTETGVLEMHMKTHESLSEKRFKFLGLMNSRLTPRRRLYRQVAQPHPRSFCQPPPRKSGTKPALRSKGRPKVNIPLSEAEEFKCATCLQTFQNMDDLSLHLKNHVDQMPFVCTECGEMFTVKEAFEDHLINHSKKANIPATPASPRNSVRICKTCGRSFPNQAALIVHERVHSGERPYLCTHCGKAFKQMSAFQSHMRTHTGETPYKCKICGMAFRQLGELQRHVRKHTGEKPHLCMVCGNRFAELSYLKSHMRQHTGEKPFQCKHCDKSFSQRTSLKVHLKCHHKSLADGTLKPVHSTDDEKPAQDIVRDPHQSSQYHSAFPLDMSAHMPMGSYNMPYLTSEYSHQADRDSSPMMPISLDASYYA